MDGLLLKFNDDYALRTGLWFRRLFSSIYQELDRYYWCFVNQPWMGLPLETLDRQDDFEGEIFEPFEERCQSSIQLWRPKTLTKYASLFAEEYVELWAIKPELDPSRIATMFSARGFKSQDGFIQEHASIWLIYTDSTCWEVFAEDKTLLDRVNESLSGKPWVDVYRSNSNHRGQAFGMAGLSQVWRACHGP